MLHSDHIDGTELHSFTRAHQIAYHLRELAKEQNMSNIHVKVLSKRDIITHNLGNADAMITWDITPEGWPIDAACFNNDFVHCTDAEKNTILFYDII